MTGRRQRAAVVASLAAVAVLTLLSSLTPTVPWRAHLLEALEPGTARTAGQVVSLAGGALLLLLLPGVARGTRRATGRAMAVLYVLAVAHAAKGLDYEEAGLALALVPVLRAGARRPVGERALAGAVALAALASAFALELIVLLVDGRQLHVGETLAGVWHAISGGWAPGTEALAVVVWGLIAVGLGASLVAVLALLRPDRADAGHSEPAHERAADIVASWGEDSLAPFLLRQDKAFFFAHGGVLAYRTLRETAVVSSDPVGPPGTAPAIVRDFLDHAAARGWEVVMTAASEHHLDAYRRLGLRVLRIGSEAVVDPSAFTLEGRAVRKLRQSVNRVAARGWSVEVIRAAELDAATVAGIGCVERAWRADRPRLQGFAMAMDRLWGAPEDARDLYVVARDPSGELRAFLRFLRHRRGLSLDAMRRLAGTPNGLNEALVAAALAHAAAEGDGEVSLNFAGFAHVMAADAALGPGQRLGRALLERMHGRFQLERLVAFNEKFGPEWRPRYLVHSGRRRLPLAALRVMQAEAYVRPPREARAGTEPGTGWVPAGHPVTGGAP